MVGFNLTAEDFFGGIFIGSYVCAMQPEKGGQTNGCIPFNDSQKPDFPGFDKYIEDRFFGLNNSGWGIHFTPNGMSSVNLRNRPENCTHVNAWWAEIDIEETKVITDPIHDEPIREDKKARIAGALWTCGLDPSLVVETRNGFQVYWFAKSATKENFDKIEELINEKFKDLGADKAATTIAHTLRVPYFKFDKNDERGFITVFEALSSLKLYTEEEMFDWLKDVTPIVEAREQAIIKQAFFNDMLTKTVKMNRYHKEKTKSVFDRINETPIPLVLERLSGRDEVRGDKFVLMPIKQSGKANVLVNGHSSPNWVDTNKNLIFSNNVSGMATMIHYLEYYGLSRKEAIELLSVIIQ